jgi:hypothetical protein
MGGWEQRQAAVVSRLDGGHLAGEQQQHVICARPVFVARMLLCVGNFYLNAAAAAVVSWGSCGQRQAGNQTMIIQSYLDVIAATRTMKTQPPNRTSCLFWCR